MLGSAGYNPYTLIGVALIIGIVPIVVGFATAYLKISIVLGMIRNALGGQQIPGQIVTAALAIVLTVIVMESVLERSLSGVESVDLKTLGEHPLREGQILLKRMGEPWRDFLFRHTGERELRTLERLMQRHRAEKSQSVSGDSTSSIAILTGGFILTELREAFLMACVLLVPFVVIDLLVANLLVGLGMFMVSPVMIALPLKLAAFYAVDGWLLLAEALVRSYGEV